MTSRPSGLTERLAQFSMDLRYEDLPPNVVELAKHCLLDWLGVTIAGIGEPLTEILLAQMMSEGGNRQATIIGDGRKCSQLQAALINGTVSHALDFDDVSERMHGHPTAPVAPVLLALAEQSGATGRQFIEALVASIEVECRLNQFMNEVHYERGWHSTATVGTIGAAVGGARLLGFDTIACAKAMGVAATQAAGLRAQFGTMCKPLHAGKAAYNGLFSVQLVARGFTSRSDILETPLGFGATLSDAPDAGRALDGLGGRFEIEDVLFKYHAACHGVHATLEAIRALRLERNFAIDEVSQVEIALNPEYLNICAIEVPKTGLEGKFSLKFCAALALASADTSKFTTFSDAAVSDARYTRLMPRIALRGDASIPMKVTTVTIRLQDGVELINTYDAGVPEADLHKQWRSICAKFLSCAVPVIGPTRARSVIQLVSQLEDLSDLRLLMTKTAAPARRRRPLPAVTMETDE